MSHSLAVSITCTCCYDEIKRIQDQDLFSCSFSDSLYPACPNSADLRDSKILSNGLISTLLNIAPTLSALHALSVLSANIGSRVLEQRRQPKYHLVSKQTLRRLWHQDRDTTLTPATLILLVNALSSLQHKYYHYIKDQNMGFLVHLQIQVPSHMPCQWTIRASLCSHCLFCTAKKGQGLLVTHF